MAREAHFDMLRKTNPWRSKEDIEKERAESSDPELAQAQIMAWAAGMQGEEGRQQLAERRKARHRRARIKGTKTPEEYAENLKRGE